MINLLNLFSLAFLALVFSKAYNCKAPLRWQNRLRSKCSSTSPPSPPNPDMCCRSGCSNCVYLYYAQELEKYFRDGGKQTEKILNDLIKDETLKQFIKMELKHQK